MTGKLSVLILGIVCLLGGAGYFAFQRSGGTESGDGWKEYKYPDDGFAISAPSKPVPEPHTEEDPGYRGYVINYGNHTVVEFFTSPYSMWGYLSPAEKLQRLEESQTNGTTSKLVSEKKISLGGNPGIELEVESTGFHTRSRWYVVNDKILALYSSASSDAPFASDTDRMFDSLRLLDNGK